jgi:hypothetical protein
LLLKSDLIYRKRHEKNQITWKKKLQANNINNILIVLTTDFIISKSNNIERYWKKVKKVYVNNQIIESDKLYKRKYFIYQHSGVYYVLLINKSVDSLVYKYPPINQYEEYIGKKNIIETQEFYSKQTYHRKYKSVLPECGDLF